MLKQIIGDKKVAICKIGKFQEDFQYVFDEIQPECYIDNHYPEKEFRGRTVFRVDELEKEQLRSMLIIICDLEAHLPNTTMREWQELDCLGLEMGENYIFAEELFSTLDYNWRDSVKGRKIAFWGTGAITRNFYMKSIPEKTGLLPDIYIDKDKEKAGRKIHNVEVFTPEQIEGELRQYFIVVMNHDWYHEVYSYLTERGYVEGEDFISYHLIFDQTHAPASEMMRKTVYATPIKNQPFCKHPFEMVHLRLNGSVNLCTCPNYIDQWYANVGDYFYSSYEKIWNSAAAKIFRLSIINKTFCFCYEKMCDIMMPTREEEPDIPRNEAIRQAESPLHVFSEMDDSCNLVCPSCRIKPQFNEKGRTQDKRLIMVEKLNRSGWLESADKITVAGFGEAFYSKVHREMIYHKKENRRKHITILSNGNLFSEKEFQRLLLCYENISTIVSVDGATKEVYEKLRPNGNFAGLIENLRNLGTHRLDGTLKDFQINFVVQRENFHQMKDMVQLCEDINVDRLMFIRMMNWLYPQEIFDEKSMTNADGSLKPELEEVLQDPIFKSNIVYMPWFAHRMG